MLTDVFSDFTSFAKEPDADLPALLAELEEGLSHYADESWGYNRQVFPLLRQAARWYVAGKISWRELNGIRQCLMICYLGLVYTEQMLVEDLIAYMGTVSTSELRTEVSVVRRRRRIASQGKDLYAYIRSETTSSGVSSVL